MPEPLFDEVHVLLLSVVAGDWAMSPATAVELGMEDPLIFRQALIGPGGALAGGHAGRRIVARRGEGRDIGNRPHQRLRRSSMLASS